MEMGTLRGKYEQRLGRAHRALWYAKQASQELGLDGAEDDLDMLLEHCARLTEDSLASKRRRPRPQPPTQMTVDDFLPRPDGAPVQQ